MENTTHYFVFLLRRLEGVRERHVLPKRERLLVLGQKRQSMIFFWRRFGRKTLSSGCFTWKRWELYQVNFKLANTTLCYYLILQILTIYPVFRSKGSPSNSTLQMNIKVLQSYCLWEKWGWKEPNLQNPLLAASCHFLASCKAVIARILAFRQRQVQHQSWWKKWPILCALPLFFRVNA